MVGVVGVAEQPRVVVVHHVRVVLQGGPLGDLLQHLEEEEGVTWTEMMPEPCPYI